MRDDNDAGERFKIMSLGADYESKHRDKIKWMRQQGLRYAYLEKQLDKAFRLLMDGFDAYISASKAMLEERKREESENDPNSPVQRTPIKTKKPAEC